MLLSALLTLEMPLMPTPSSARSSTQTIPKLSPSFRPTDRLRIQVTASLSSWWDAILKGGSRRYSDVRGRVEGRDGRGQSPNGRLSVTVVVAARRARLAQVPQQLPRDHQPLDLVRTLVDLCDLRVAHHSLDRVLL